MKHTNEEGDNRDDQKVKVDGTTELFIKVQWNKGQPGVFGRFHPIRSQVLAQISLSNGYTQWG